MNKRERARFEKQVAESNARLEAEHAVLRQQIAARRPGWDAAKLAGIRQTYGTTAEGLPGLADLLEQVAAADALNARLGSGS